MTVTGAPQPLTDPQSFALEEAALRPIARPGRLGWVVLGLLGLLVLAGIGAYVVQLGRGIGVTGLNDQVFWGTYEANMVAFIGLSYGGALVSAILRLTHARWRASLTRIAEATALASLAVGALFPIIHLGRPERVWEMFVRPNLQSPIFWDLAAILTYLLATLTLFLLPTIPDLGVLKSHERLGPRLRGLYSWGSAGWRGTAEQESTLHRALTVVSVVIIPVAIMVHTVLSYAFSLTSRPGWSSTIWGPYFVVGAIYSGIALVVVCASVYRHVYRLHDWITSSAVRNLSYLMVALGLLYGYLTFTEITTEGYVGEEAASGVLYTLLLARYSPWFWAFVVGGIIVPTILVALPRTRTMGGITTAAVLIIVSMWMKRLLLIIPPLTRPLVEGPYGTYSPSWVEITISAAAWAAIPLLVILIFKVVPVLSPYEIRSLQSAEVGEETSS